MSTTFLPANSVADFIGMQIEKLGKLQSEVAKEAGFDKPNLITMIKQGKTKLPLAKIGLMARSLEVDPIYMFALCMNEYMPETWEAIESLKDQPLLTKNEVEIIKAVRAAGTPTTLLGPSDHGNLVRAIQTVYK